MSSRADFTEKTKRIAAEKVAYLCSNPECKRFTIASDGKGRSHHYGEAAHIYAAANGGPRANPAMSDEELKSESNCLWLCNSCHELIDAIPNRYNPELLKEWKSSAEARATNLVQSKKKSDGFLEEIESSSGLSSFFDDLFLRGDFEKIALAIRHLSKKDGLSKEDKDEVWFAQTRFDAFCARKNLETNLNWVGNASPRLLERLVDFAIETFDSDLCAKTGIYSSEVYKRKLAGKIADHEDIQDILSWTSSSEEYAKYGEMLRPFQIVGAIFSRKVSVDERGQRISHRRGWLLEICDTISSLVYDFANGLTVDDERLRPISDKLSIFLWLDPYYLSHIFDGFIGVFPKSHVFESFARKMIDKGCSTPLLRIHYFFDALSDSRREKEIEYALELGKKYNDSRLLLYTLNFIGQKRPESVIKFVDENYSLAKSDLFLIWPYFEAKRQMGQSFALLEYLDSQYVGAKNENYHLLRALALDECGDEDAVAQEWAKYKNCADLDGDYIPLALRLAGKRKDGEFVAKVCKESDVVSFIFEAAEIIYISFPNPNNYSVAMERLKAFHGNLPPQYNRLMFALLCKLNRLEDALHYGEKAFSEEAGCDLGPTILQVRIELGKYEEDEFVRVIATKAHDAQTLRMLGELYLGAGDKEKGWNYVAESAAVEGKADSKTTNSLYRFVDCDCFEAIRESCDYSLVTLSNGVSFLLLPPREKVFFGKKILNTAVYYSDARKDLCFLAVGDQLDFENEAVTVKEVRSYLYFFHCEAMKAFALSPSALEFRSNNPQEAVSQLSTFVLQTKKRQDEFLASTDGKLLPFWLFQKAFGRGVFGALEALYYSDKRKSFFYLREKGSPQKPVLPLEPFFDAESFYLAYRLGITPETIRKSTGYITGLTKGLLLNEIVQKENDYKSAKECGTLTVFGEDNKIGYLPRTKEERRGALKELQKMRGLLNSFQVLTPTLVNYTEEQNQVLSSLRGANEDRVDAELLEVLWSGKTIVSNNRSLCLGARLGKGKVIDFSDFLAACPCSAKEGVNAVIGLQKTNIIQYLTPDVFNSLIAKINAMEEGVDKEEAIDAMLKLINGEWPGADKSKNRYMVYLASKDEQHMPTAPARIRDALQKLSDDLIREYLANFYRPIVGV